MLTHLYEHVSCNDSSMKYKFSHFGVGFSITLRLNITLCANISADQSAISVGSSSSRHSEILKAKISLYNQHSLFSRNIANVHDDFPQGSVHSCYNNTYQRSYTFFVRIDTPLSKQATLRIHGCTECAHPRAIANVSRQKVLFFSRNDMSHVGSARQITQRLF